MQLTAIAQKLQRGFRVTFQFSEATPSLIMTALGVIQATPGSSIISYSGNTIEATSTLPWDLLYTLRGRDSIGGAPFGISFFNFDSVAIAHASFDMNPDVLAGHLHGKSLLPQQLFN
jgi:hypothetical protein